MTRRRLWIGIAVLVAIQAGAFGLYKLKTRRSVESTPFANETLAVREAPVLAFERANGQRSTLAYARGEVVMVHFWATWCEPCRDELPGLLARADELAAHGRFELIAVAVDDDWDAIRRFFGGTVPPAIVRPEQADIHRRFGASTLPDTYLVDASGKLVIRYAGARDWADPRAHADLARAIDVHGQRR